MKTNTHLWDITPSQAQALEAVFEQLSKEYPAANWMQSTDMTLAIDYIKNKQNYQVARVFAIAAGVPPDRLDALEALLF